MPSSQRLYAWALLAASASLAVTVTVPLAAPSSSPTVSAALISLSIEGDNWLDWSGATSQNSFTNNVLSNLQKLTGTPTNIRVGADSEDRTNYNPALGTTVQLTVPPYSASNPYPEASTVVVGDGYYLASQYMPAGTHMIWGVNFGTNNVTAATLEAKSILKAFKNSAITSKGIVLDSIEIGNEPDLYGNNGKRPSNWTIATYTSTWATFAKSVVDAVGLKAGTAPTLLGLSFASSDHGAGKFSPQQAFADGYLSSSVAPLIKSISQHKYYGGCCSALVSDLMSKSFIRGNLTLYKPDIAAVKGKGLSYSLGETNSYFNHGVPNVSDAGGAAIWLLDSVLLGATYGVDKYFFHEGVGYKYNLFQPVTLTRSTEDGSTLSSPSPPHVQAPYYGAIVVNEFLGTSSGRTIVELSFSSSTLSGYALYVNGVVKKAVVANSQAWLTSSTGSRPTQSIQFSFSGSGTSPKSMTLKRLAIPHADAKTGLLWGGQTYETSSGLPSGSVVTSTSPASSSFTVSSSEIVLATFS